MSMDPFALILLIISGVAWAIVYVESIRIGLQRRLIVCLFGR